MTDTHASSVYRVLARKYRPETFDQLIGQDALVRTLSNAIASGRVAHAFMLTGVRGVGKTTTARIVARALNCIGPDGQGGPTVTPCGQCDNCIAIRDDRHVDVMEMDAASRTGVDDIRELIDGVRYRPVSARFKVYIVDEVHMLSRNAFNALLKTLEEPPEHVKFIFATTEIRKVPVTVLSRCQRFDLRRVEMEKLVAHFSSVAEKEGVSADEEAIRLIARAADGSVRDGLSLLDQALVPGADRLTAADVREMLGLADRSAVYDLFDRLMAGAMADALDQFDGMYRDGADPLIVFQDLLDVVYWLTRLKTSPAVADATYTPETERTRGRELAGRLPMSILTRAWQLLLKGVGEIQSAPNPMQAAQMALVRIGYAADLPAPAALVRELSGSTDTGTPAGPSRSRAGGDAVPVGTGGGVSAPGPTGRGGPTALARAHPRTSDAEPKEAIADAPQAEAMPAPAKPQPQSFREVVDLFRSQREMILCANLTNNVHLVRFEPGRIEIRTTEEVPRDLVNRVSGFLNQWTGRRWVVSVSSEQGAPTLAEQASAEDRRLRDEAEADELVQAVKNAFPGARVTKVIPREPVDSVGPTVDDFPEPVEIEEED